MSKKEYKDLGNAKDWGEKNPPEYDACKHSRKKQRLEKNKYLFTCDKCKIIFIIDAGTK